MAARVKETGRDDASVRVCWGCLLEASVYHVRDAGINLYGRCPDDGN